MVLAHDIVEGSRTKDIHIIQNVTFESMLLTPLTLQGLQQCGFFKPSPVQLNGIPLGKCGFDLLLEAKSGTGKTVVFSVTALEKLDLNKGLQVVMLAPTREIASQICDVIKQIGKKYEGLVVEVVMGGLPVEEDISKFKKNVHIVVGSPGRLRHLIQDKHINVSAVRLLVLDEADKLMEKSFQIDINYIFSILPQQKQVILSSATFTDFTKTFIEKYVKNAQHICPDSNCVLLGVEQKVTTVKFNANIVRQTQHRFEELLKILTKKPFKQCLIFCNYQARVTELHKLLTRKNWPAEQLYGQQDQVDRLGALKTLQEYKCRILISTDLAARGIDASNVDLVINFEPPSEWQTYLHRIGRAGRYGSYGISITILSEGKEATKFRNMLEAIKSPLNISNLWGSDKMGKVSETDVKLQTVSTDITSNVKEDTHQKLWKEFTHIEGTKEIDNFETLCQSFDTSMCTEVESFNDLILSFRKDQHPPDEMNAKKLEDNSQDIKSFSESLKILNTLHQNLNTTFEIKNKLPLSFECCENSEYKESKEGNINSTNQENISGLNGAVVEKNSQHYEGLLKSDDEESASKLALIEAGLPTSFASSKGHLNKTSILKSSKHNNNKHHRYPISEKFTRQEIKPNNESDSDSSDRSLHIKPKPLRVKNNQKKYRKSSDKNKTTDESESQTTDCDLSSHYISWYQHLKYRMKLIEMALYLEEIKLN